MKKCITIIASGVLALAALAACKQDDVHESALQVSTHELSDVKQTSAVGSGYITVNHTGAVTRLGVCWNMTGSPTVDDRTADAAEKIAVGNFTAPLSGLTPATTYYVRAFVQAAGTTVYGQEIRFATRRPPGEGWCVIDGVSDITPTSAVVAMEIADNGDADVLEYGIVYNDTGNPELDDTKVVSEPGGYIFKANLTDLNQDTEYFVRPYFVTDAGTIFGEEATFRTINFIRTGQAFPGYRSAYLYGQVIMDAGSETTERGIVWGPDPDPTLENDAYKSVGKGVGTYYLLTGGLEKDHTYYMRAYAKNEGGTYYGLNVEFTTKTGDVLPGFDLSQMVLVERGSFVMGEKDTETTSSAIQANTFGKEPQHEVRITRDFYMCSYEVTNEQLCNFLNSYQSTRRRNLDQALYNGSGRTFSFNVSGSAPNLSYMPVSGAARKPASNFTWGCAQQYLEWLSAELGVTVRFPTEAEWEYAARGGNRSQGYTYSGSNTYSEVAVFTNSSTGPAVVGTKKANELGIYDMNGNVFEYCADAFHWDYYLPMVGVVTDDPYLEGNPNAERVIRGGSFRHNAYFRVSARGKTTNEADCGNHSGLRIVMTSLPDGL